MCKGKPTMKITTRLFVARLCLASLLSAICNCSFTTDEESLRASMLNNYNSKVRPAFQTRVSAGLVLGSLNHLNIAGQWMSVTALISLQWNDSRLMWNPSSYGGLKSFVTSPEDIWSPPVVIENAVDDVGVIGGAERDRVPLRIAYTGQVSWSPPQVITTSCEMAIAHYPFDTQRCVILLLGWTYPVSEVMISAVDVDRTTLYIESGEFDLIYTRVYESNISHEAQQLSDMYRKLQFELTYRRRWQFYGQNLIMPIVLNSILMGAVFVLPIESGEKIGYSLTVLLTYIVFMTWVTEKLPPVSTDTSILQVYLAIVLAMGCLATMLTTWVLHLYHTNPNKHMRKTFRVIASKVLVPFSNLVHGHRNKKTKAKDRDVYEPELPARVAKVSPMPTSVANEVPAVATDDGASGEFEPSTKADPKQILDWFEPSRKESDRNKRDTTPTWQQLAKLFDCFFLWTFAAVMNLLTVVVMTLLYGFY